MDYLKQSWTKVQAQLEGMPASSKALIGSLLVIMLLVGYITMLYAGRPEQAIVGSFSSGQTQMVINRLQARGVEAELLNGQVVVPVSQQDTAFIVMAENDLLTSDMADVFDQLVENYSPLATDSENQRRMLIAKQSYLRRVISKMNGVRSAEVIVSPPERDGFGATFVRPSGSVAVTMVGGQTMNQKLAESIAGLVSSSLAEMTPQDVTVIDSNTGQQYSVKDENDVIPSDAFELVRKLEQEYSKKISRTLSYIPGVIVAVNVRTDDVHRRQALQFELDKNEPLRSTRKLEQEDVMMADAGEPGIRSNTGLSIAGSGGEQTRSTLSEQEDTFGEKAIIGEVNTVHTGHNVQQVNVTVNVPRTFFVNLWRSVNPEAETPPADADLEPFRQDHLQQIIAQVEPLVEAEEDSIIRAHMIPDDTLFAQPAAASMGTFAMMLESPMATPAILGGLAVVSIGLMLMMVRNANKPEKLPSVEELAGLPPALPSDEDLIGEVEELEETMAGFEIDPEDLESRKIAEQIGELIKANPEEAGTLMKRWVGEDD